MHDKTESEIWINRKKYCSKGRKCTHRVCQKARRDFKKLVKDAINEQQG